MKNETSLLKVHTFFVKIFAKICCPISKPLCPIIFLIFLFVLSRLFYAETTVSRNETSNQDTSKKRKSNGLVKKKIKNQTLTKTVQHFTPPCLTFGVFTVCIIVQHVQLVNTVLFVCHIKLFIFLFLSQEIFSIIFFTGYRSP